MKKSKKAFDFFGAIITGMFLVFFIASLVYFLQAITKPVTIKDNEASDMTPGVALYTSPTAISAIKGESLTVDLDINTQTEEVSGADIILKYDKNYLVVNSIILRDFFTKLLKKSDDLEGTISLILAAQKDKKNTGNGTLVSITFTALKTGVTTINYGDLTQVAASDKLINVLTNSSGTTININDSPAVISSNDKENGSDIYLFASGTMGGGQYPTMELVIKNEKVFVFENVVEEQKQYFYHHPSGVKLEDIKIKFVNDHNDETGDRNLKINKIQIDGKDYETEDQSTYSVGTWNQNSCGRGFKKSEWLYCNGEFKYMKD